jgi:hypothetical protein
VIFRSGNPYVAQPILSDVAVSSQSVLANGSFSVQFAFFNPVPTSILNLFLVVGRDISGIVLVASEVKTGRSRISIDASLFSRGHQCNVMCC